MKAYTSAFIYALLDAEGCFDYVGQSVNPKKRFRDHKSVGIIIAEVPWEKRKEHECYFIALFSAQGCLLRNKNKGGGGPGQLSPETLAKLRGRKHSPETRAKISAANKRRKNSPETRAKISAANAGRKYTPHSLEALAKMRAARTGSKHSPETREKISAARMGKTHSPETRAKISAANLRREKAPLD